MIFKIILFIQFVMLSACATTVSNVKSDHKLSKSNGLFLTKLQTNHPFKISLKDSSGSIIWLNKENTEIKSDVLAVSLPKGKYTIHQIAWGNESIYFSKKETFNFLIKKGKVNYICDLGAYFTIKNTNKDLTDKAAKLKFVLPVYLKQSTYLLFKKAYPVVYKKYPFISSPVSMCVRGKSKKALQLTKLLS